MEKTVAVIGLGYVGLPVACLCAYKYKVIGADIDESRISLIKEGKSPIKDENLENELKKFEGKIEFTTDIEGAIKKADIVVICVPTPVDKDHMPNLTALKAAADSISKSMKENTLVIIESTIFPGTTEEIILPILKNSNVNKFYLAHCPERIDPGNKDFTIERIPRVVGGIDPDSSEKALQFYGTIIGSAKIKGLSSIKAVEATKMMENTFRDINIAFINEMAKSFDKAGIDISEVIEGAKSKPFAFKAHYPGVGVGGHCIPVDPYYLIEKAKQIGFNHEFLSLARKINDSMPNYAIELLESKLKTLGKEIKNAKIGVLGLAYKADIDDVRESPALKVINILKDEGAEVYVFDPYVKKGSNVKDLNELLIKSDYIVLVTDHKEFKEINLDRLKENSIKVVIDGRNCWDKEKIKSMGIFLSGYWKKLKGMHYEKTKSWL